MRFGRPIAAHAHDYGLLESRVARLAAEARSHKSAKQAEIVEVTDQWLGNDGGTEPKRGRSVSFSLVRIPFRLEGSANHFSEAMPC